MGENGVATVDKWQKTAKLVCFYGFFIHFLPSEPYFVPFLMSPHHNLTEDEIVGEILPIWTYGYLVFLFPVFLLTDIVRYKPVIVSQGFGWIACYLCLIFGHGVPLMKLVEVFYSVGTAAEVAYNSYIYSVIPTEHYQKYTAYTRAVFLLASSLSSILAQILVSFCQIDYVYLNVISAVSVTIATGFAITLPTPNTSMFFNAQQLGKDEKVADEKINEDDVTIPLKIGTSSSCTTCLTTTAFSRQNQFQLQSSPDELTTKEKVTASQVIRYMLVNVKLAYTNKIVLIWSIWWALSTCGWLSVVNYIQSLWQVIDPLTNLNGVVVTTSTVLGSLGAFSVKWLDLSKEKWNAIAIGFASCLICCSLLLIHFTTNIWVSYISYIIFIFLFNFVITVTQYQFSLHLASDVFALILGANTFLALGLNTVLTVVLVEDVGLGLPVNIQFIIYGAYFGVISIVFILHGSCHRGNGNDVDVSLENLFPNIFVSHNNNNDDEEI